MQLQQLRVILYVDNLDRMGQFWQENLGVTNTKTESLNDEFQHMLLNLSDAVQLDLMPKAFARELSPELDVEAAPSLMFFVKAFDALHEQLAPNTPIMTQGTTDTFNFADPEGNFFVLARAN